MVEIKFEYRDAMSHWEWKEQECCCETVQDCIDFYGLGVDCDYKIISVDKIGD